MSRMLPNSTPRASLEKILGLVVASGLWKDTRVTRLNVVAVRGYYLNTMGRRGVNDRGIYDDAMFVVSPDTFTAFNANTDPSRWRDGIAVLEAPQRVTYQKGYHGYGKKSGHPAFRQASSVVVVRDGGWGNGKALGDGRFTDAGRSRFWINLHRGGVTTTSSAGCQTVPPNQWDAFYGLVSLQMKRFGQDTFSYWLI